MNSPSQLVVRASVSTIEYSSTPLQEKENTRWDALLVGVCVKDIVECLEGVMEFLGWH